MGLFEKTAKAAFKASPLGGVTDTLSGALESIGGALGIGGKGPGDIRKDRYRLFHERLKAGDFAHVQATADRSKYPGLRVEAQWVLRQAGRGVSLEAIVQQLQATGGLATRRGQAPDVPLNAQTRARNGGGWRTDSFTGPAPVAAPVSPGKPPKPSAPSAPPAKPPCKYGLRLPDGTCPKRPKAEPRGLTGEKGARPCKYGPRDADGRCPKKPSGLAAGRLSKGQSKLLRRAETAAGNVIKRGLSGATSGIRAAVATAGVGATAATIALVAAVGAAAWFIGQDIQRSLSGENAEVRRVQAALDRKHAREALARELGRAIVPGQPFPLTKAEQKPIDDAYARRLRIISGDLRG